jgi:hypothetical protein
MLIRRARGIAALLVVLSAGTAWAAYFHEAHRSDALLLSDRTLKTRFHLPAAAGIEELSAAEAAAIVAVAPDIGLFEQDGGIRVPNERCTGDGPKARACRLEWESKRLAQSKGVVTRKAAVLTLRSKAGPSLTLADWNQCAPRGECDGERYTYLGPLGRSGHLAVEIEYGHDSPSLVLFHATTGRLTLVHYGSEPTFLSPTDTLLVNAEDLNDATSLLVTDLAGDAPALDLQCLGTRTADVSFGVTFKRWVSAATFDIVLAERRRGAAAPEKIPLRFVRGGNAWTVHAPVDLKARGFECRARTARAAQ